jgi:hypothetical protein
MAFNLPAQTGLAPLKPAASTVTPWTRPVDWPTITDTAGEVQFLVTDTGLATYAISTAFTRTASQDLIIDWGDGTTSTVSTTSATTTQHTYTVGTGTPCSRGYTTFTIRIYGSAAGVTINTARFLILTTAINNSIPYPLNTIGVLEAYYGDGVDISSFAEYFQGSQGTLLNSQGIFSMLEYCKLPVSMPNTTSFANAFDYCYALAKVVMPTSAPNLTSFGLTFRNCVNLESLTLPSNATAITNISNICNGCVRLTSVTLPTSLNLVTDASQAFLTCRLLNTISLPAMDLCTTYSSMFANCASLANFKMTSWTSTSQVITTNSMFSSCFSLQAFTIPNPVAGTSFSMLNMFVTCSSLLQITFPTNWNTADLSNAFQNCYNLITVTFPSSMNLLATLTSTFSSCLSLQNVTLPTTVAATITASSAFTSCISLRTLTIPSGWALTDISAMFSTCSSLKSITLPTSSTGIITLGSTFSNCATLETVILPSALTACQSLSSTFQNCSKLTSVTLPATMNACTSISSAFSGCYNLTSVTLPTSMTVVTSFSACFLNCTNLTSVTLPATIGTTTFSNFGTCFSGCSNLKTVTLMSNSLTSTSAALACGGMFANCVSLTTVNNVSALNGSGNPTIAADLFNTFCGQLSSLDFYNKFSKLTLSGTATNRNNLTTLRVRNVLAGQYGGTSPQIAVQYCNLDTAALNQVFTDLPTVTSKTINITGATGAATCTRSIATAKGWTVTG